MPKKIFIGVDGGATKCQCRIEDCQGRLLGEARGGPANIRLSVEDTWHSIHLALQEALRQANLRLEDKRYAFYAGMALAGCEIKSARERFLAESHPFRHIVLESDAYAACLAANGGEDGSIIIVGTGVVGMQIANGSTTRVAGWGFPYGDEGGGAWLGLEAIRLTLQWQDDRNVGSPLLQAIHQTFDTDTQKMVAWASQANSTAFATLAPRVIDHSLTKDPHAMHLMRQAGQCIDAVGAALATRAGRPLPCSLFGGLAPFMVPWLGSALRERLQPSRLDATLGAIMMIKRHQAVTQPGNHPVAESLAP